MKILQLCVLLVAFPASVRAQTVTVPAADGTAPFRLTPIATIAEHRSGDAAAFGAVAGVAFDTAGNVYVLDSGNYRVAVFAPDGRHIRSLGRRGGGPGELRTPVGLVVLRDQRVIVGDAAAGVLHVFAADGNFLYDLPYRPTTVLLPRLQAHPAGWLVLQEPPTRRDAAGRLGIHRLSPAEDSRPEPWLQFGGSGAPAPTRVVETGTGVFRRSVPPLFSPGLHVTPFGPGLALSFAEDYRIALWSQSGALRHIERPLPPRRVSASDQERAREAWIERQRGAGAAVNGFRAGGGDPAQLRASAAQLTFAEYVPHIRALGTDADGRLWVGRTGRDPFGDGPIDIYSPVGDYVGTLPPQTFPAAFGPAGRLAQLVVDSLGVTSVRIARAAPPR